VVKELIKVNYDKITSPDQQREIKTLATIIFLYGVTGNTLSALLGLGA